MGGRGAPEVGVGRPELMKRAPPSEDSGAAGAGASAAAAEASTTGAGASGAAAGAVEAAGAGADSSDFELVRVGESVVGAEAASGAEDSASA